MRTRLRGLEIAGIQMGIEVPETYDWQWPESAISEYVCLPREPEVHVGLRVAEISGADLGGERYRLGAWTFEVASSGDDWLLGLSRRGQREQLARFDRDFRQGEVVVTRATAAERRFPLRTPLDEWIVLHRTVARGGLILSGTARRDGLRASVRLGTPPSGPSTHRRAFLGRNTVLLREEGGCLRHYETPWCGMPDPLLAASSPLSECVVAEAALDAYRECIDPDEAAEALIAHAVVPLCDERLLDHVLANARKMSTSMKVVRVGEVEEASVPMDWQSAQLQEAFAPPGYGQ